VGPIKKKTVHNKTPTKNVGVMMRFIDFLLTVEVAMMIAHSHHARV
jgi:hypothetical protein